jgi:flagellar biosynthesis/type III secretory pathway protein FliH
VTRSPFELAVPTDPALQTSDDKEFLMHTYDLAEAWRREAIEEGVKQGREGGLQKGREEGLQKGREEGLARSVIDIYEARFDVMPADLRAIVESTHDEETLRGWLRLAGTCDANEVAATIRAVQPR